MSAVAAGKPAETLSHSGDGFRGLLESLNFLLLQKL